MLVDVCLWCERGSPPGTCRCVLNNQRNLCNYQHHHRDLGWMPPAFLPSMYLANVSSLVPHSSGNALFIDEPLFFFFILQKFERIFSHAAETKAVKRTLESRNRVSALPRLNYSMLKARSYIVPTRSARWARREIDKPRRQLDGFEAFFALLACFSPPGCTRHFS